MTPFAEKEAPRMARCRDLEDLRWREIEDPAAFQRVPRELCTSVDY